MWAAGILGAGGAHLAVHAILGLGTYAQVAFTDLTITAVALVTTVVCARTARRCREPNVRGAWHAMTFGIAAWLVGALGWDVRELLIGPIAPATSWADAPFFAMAPSFAVALACFRHNQPSRVLQLKHVADLGIVVAAMTIVGAVLFAAPLAAHGGTPFALVALGYPCLYLSLVVVALGALGQRQWGRRQVVLGVLVWSQLAFASVDLLFGASTLVDVFQTSGLEDTLWLIGMLSLCWAAAEERALLDAPDADERATAPTSWNAIVVAVALVALVGFLVDAADALRGGTWLVLAIAAGGGLGCVILRMWAAERLEEAYRGALADGAAKGQALAAALTDGRRWRAVGTVAGGTAHEVNNLLQAIAGNLELLRRRAARGEEVGSYLASIERALWQARDEVKQLRALAPADGGLRGTVLVTVDADGDGRTSAALTEAGFATAVLPDLGAILRATKGVEVRAIVALPRELIAVTDALEGRGLHVPVVAANRLDDLSAIDVSRVVAAIEATAGLAGAGSPQA
jgi:signal transduction histidine kinase